MKEHISIALLLFVVSAISFGQTSIDSNWSSDIKSVFLSTVSSELEMPIIRMANDGKPTNQLLLRFDHMSAQPEDMRYRFIHCNSSWEKDNMEAGEYYNGNVDGNIENFQSSFTTLRNYTNYYQTLPDRYGQFLASGNYLLEVYPADHPDSILFTRRFYVMEELVEIDATITKPAGAFGRVTRDQEISVGVATMRNSFLPTQADFYTVVVQQNRRDDLKRILPFNGYSGSTMQYRWHAENVFPGGNNFRYFDMSNLHATMYHVQRIDQWGGEVFAFLQPEEDRSMKPYTQYNSLNGGMKTNIRDRHNPHIESDYVWVNFSLPMARPYLNGNIYIVGDLTLWRLNEESRMEWNSTYHTYTKRMLLKQGYYSYQLLFLPTNENEALTATLEGDHYEMPNSYTVYVYYRQPGARYERLVGVKTVFKGEQ